MSRQLRYLRKRTQSMQSDSCTFRQERRLSLCVAQTYASSDTSSYSEILQKINDGITCQKIVWKVITICVLSDFGDDDFGFQTVCNIVCSRKNRSGRKLPKIYDLLDYLNNCYREPISGVLIEEQLGGNFDYLNRFSSDNRKTIFQYLTEVRISHAKELLGTTCLNFAVSEKSDFPMKVIFQ